MHTRRHSFIVGMIAISGMLHPQGPCQAAPQDQAPLEQTVVFKTFQEKGVYVPVQVVLSGATHHSIAVLGNNSLADAQVKLRPDTVYSIKLRYGTQGRFAYTKAEDLKIPPHAQGADITVAISRDAVHIRQSRTSVDSNMSREGKGFSVSFTSNTETIYEKSHTVIQSNADEFGYLRQWTSEDGKIISAVYVASDATKITLKGMDGRVYETLLSKLSEADQAYVARFTSRPAAKP